MVSSGNTTHRFFLLYLLLFCLFSSLFFSCHRSPGDSISGQTETRCVYARFPIFLRVIGSLHLREAGDFIKIVFEKFGLL